MNEADIRDIFDEPDESTPYFATAAEMRALDYRSADKNGRLGREAVARDIYFRHVGVYLQSCIVSKLVYTPRQTIRFLNAMGYLEGLLNTKIVGGLTVTYSIINRFGDVDRELYSRVVYMVFEPLSPGTDDPLDVRCMLVNYTFDSCDVSVAECSLNGNACSIKI